MKCFGFFFQLVFFTAFSYEKIFLFFPSSLSRHIGVLLTMFTVNYWIIFLILIAHNKNICSYKNFCEMVHTKFLHMLCFQIIRNNSLYRVL